jgi:multisubunit Na+/H+ antiporter MnhF subunit
MCGRQLLMTIDIWLCAAIGFFILTFCAVLRIIPGPTLNDRLIAVNVAATLASAGALALTVSFGNLLVALTAVVLACIVFAATIRISQVHKGAVS